MLTIGQSCAGEVNGNTSAIATTPDTWGAANDDLLNRL